MSNIKSDNNHEIGRPEYEKDTSVNDARWMLAAVVLLAACVMGLGFAAESITTVQASGKTELVSE